MAIREGYYQLIDIVYISVPTDGTIAPITSMGYTMEFQL